MHIRVLCILRFSQPLVLASHLHSEIRPKSYGRYGARARHLRTYDQRAYSAIYVNGNRAPESNGRQIGSHHARQGKRRGETHSAVSSGIRGNGRAGREEIGVYVSRARTALCPYPTERETESERAREQDRKERRSEAGGRRERRGTTHRYTLYILSLNACTQSARIRRWARRWKRARWGGHRRFPRSGGGPHVWCVYTPCRRAGRPDRLLGGRRSDAEAQTRRDLPRNARFAQVARTGDRSIDRWMDRSIGAGFRGDFVTR